MAIFWFIFFVIRRNVFKGGLLKFSQRRKKMNYKIISSIFLFALLLVAAFQNCSPDISVTDRSIGLNELGDGAEPIVPILPVEPLPEDPVPLPPISSDPPVNPYIPNTPGIDLLPLIQGEWASIAFEDNFGSPDAGDRDFNDAVFNYRIAEQYNNNSELIRIFIEVKLRAAVSDGNHKLKLIFNGNPSAFFENITFSSERAFNGNAHATIFYPDGTISQKEYMQDSLLTLFKSSRNQIGQVVKVEVKILQPDLNKKISNQNFVDYRKYRFILQNIGQDDTGIDIAEINSTDEMLSNSNHYPFGFMVPAEWVFPREGQLIDEAYPKFYLYRQWLSGPKTSPPSFDAARWFIN